VRCLEKIALLMDLHQPDAVVLEDATAKGSRRSARIRRLYRAIRHLAGSRSIETHHYSRATIRKCFARFGAATKYEIAQVIARQIAAYEPLLPPPRKIWMSEDPRMGLFDATALAFTFFHLGPPAP
jgi:Holliday junction resolvasome RuvABC endonuclease subunit